MTVRLPLPRFTRSPIFLLGLAALHLYLGGGHIVALFRSAVTWTDIWKGLGATAGAYYFTALWLRAREGASSKLAAHGTGPRAPAGQSLPLGGAQSRVTVPRPRPGE